MNLIKHFIFLLLLSFLLTACNTGGSDDDKTPSLKRIDLSGTWKIDTETKRFKKSTGEYLSSSYYENSLLLDDTNNGVIYSECQNYNSSTNNYGIKTDYHFYTDPALNGFSLQSDGTLRQTLSAEYEHSPEFTFETVNILTRTADSIELDSGSLVLRGPVSVQEYSHVCLWQMTSNIGVSRDIEISVPYGNSYLSLRLDIEGKIDVGTYQYEDRYNTNSSLLLEVSSSAREFDNIVGANTLSAGNVTINIIQATNENISGSFEFTGQDSGSYSGDFEIFFNTDEST